VISSGNPSAPQADSDTRYSTRTQRPLTQARASAVSGGGGVSTLVCLAPGSLFSFLVSLFDRYLSTFFSSFFSGRGLYKRPVSCGNTRDCARFFPPGPGALYELRVGLQSRT